MDDPDGRRKVYPYQLHFMLLLLLRSPDLLTRPSQHFLEAGQRAAEPTTTPALNIAGLMSVLPPSLGEVNVVPSICSC